MCVGCSVIQPLPSLPARLSARYIMSQQYPVFTYQGAGSLDAASEQQIANIVAPLVLSELAVSSQPASFSNLTVNSIQLAGQDVTTELNTITSNIAALPTQTTVQNTVNSAISGLATQSSVTSLSNLVGSTAVSTKISNAISSAAPSYYSASAGTTDASNIKSLQTTVNALPASNTIVTTSSLSNTLGSVSANTGTTIQVGTISASSISAPAAGGSFLYRGTELASTLGGGYATTSSVQANTASINVLNGASTTAGSVSNTAGSLLSAALSSTSALSVSSVAASTISLANSDLGTSLSMLTTSTTNNTSAITKLNGSGTVSGSVTSTVNSLVSNALSTTSALTVSSVLASGAAGLNVGGSTTSQYARITSPSTGGQLQGNLANGYTLGYMLFNTYNSYQNGGTPPYVFQYNKSNSWSSPLVITAQSVATPSVTSPTGLAYTQNSLFYADGNSVVNGTLYLGDGSQGTTAPTYGQITSSGGNLTLGSSSTSTVSVPGSMYCNYTGSFATGLFGVNTTGTLPTPTANRQVLIGVRSTGTGSYQGIIQSNTAGSISAFSLCLQGASVVTMDSSYNQRNVLDDSTGGMSCTGSFSMTGNSPNINWTNAVAASAPTFTTRAASTRLVLYPGLSATSVDYAMGIGSNAMWTSVPQNVSGNAFQWYGGTTQIATLTGVGDFSFAGTINGAKLATYSGGNGIAPSGTTIYLGGTASTAFQLQANGGYVYTRANQLCDGSGNQVIAGMTTYSSSQADGSGGSAPTIGTRGSGAKIVLYPDIGASQGDWAIGVERFSGYYIWHQVPNSGCGHRWFAAATQLMALDGKGNLSLSSSSTSGTPFQVTSASTQSAGAACMGAFLQPNLAASTGNEIIVGASTTAAAALGFQLGVTASSSAAVLSVFNSSAQLSITQAGLVKTPNSVLDDTFGNMAALGNISSASVSGSLVRQAAFTLATYQNQNSSTVNNLCDNNTSTAWQPTANASGNYNIVLITATATQYLTTCVFSYQGNSTNTPVNVQVVYGGNTLATVTLGSTTAGLQTASYTFSPVLRVASGTTMSFVIVGPSASAPGWISEILLSGPQTLGVIGAVSIGGEVSVTGALTATSGLVNSAGNAIALPTSTGTLALTSQVPTLTNANTLGSSTNATTVAGTLSVAGALTATGGLINSAGNAIALPGSAGTLALLANIPYRDFVTLVISAYTPTSTTLNTIPVTLRYGTPNFTYSTSNGLQYSAYNKFASPLQYFVLEMVITGTVTGSALSNQNVQMGLTFNSVITDDGTSNGTYYWSQMGTGGSACTLNGRIGYVYTANGSSQVIGFSVAGLSAVTKGFIQITQLQ